MIYLIYGDKRDKVLVRSREIVDKSLKSNDGTLYFKFTEDDFQRARFQELIGGKSLFAEKFIVLCDGLLGSAEDSVFVSKKIQEVSSSDNIFIFREGLLNKKSLEIFKEAGSKIEEFSLSDFSKKSYAGAKEMKLRRGYEDFNIFKFTDALGSRDRKMAWVIFHKGLRAGFSAEEMFWKAVWIFRNIILASPINKNQKDILTKLDVKPNTLNNCRRFIKNYTEETLLDNYKKLVDIYHQFRRGVVDSDMALERFLLNL